MLRGCGGKTAIRRLTCVGFEVKMKLRVYPGELGLRTKKGASMMRPMNFCSRCGAKLREDAKYCQNCGAAIRPSPVDVHAAPINTLKQDPPKKIQHTEDRPMKWFMFLVYFLLIVGPFFLALYGVFAMCGAAYAELPILRDLNILIGILYIAKAVALLFARHWMVKGLKKRRKVVSDYLHRQHRRSAFVYFDRLRDHQDSCDTKLDCHRRRHYILHFEQNLF